MNARVRGLFPFKGEDARNDSSISKRNESDLHSISIPKRGSLARWKPPPESFRVSPLQWTKITLSLSLSLSFSLPCNFLPSLLSPRKEPLVRISHARHEMRAGCIGYLNDDLWLLICTIRATVRLYRKSAAVTASSVSLSLSLFLSPGFPPLARISSRFEYRRGGRLGAGSLLSSLLSRCPFRDMVDTTALS